MKAMKKTLALVLCMMLFVTVISGCRENPGESSSESVSNSSYNNSSLISSQQSTVQDASSAENTPPSSAVANTQNPDEIKDLNGRTITYMSYWNEPKKGTDQKATEYWTTKTQLEKNYNCKIEWKFASSGWQTNLVKSIMAGDPMCDVFSMPYENMVPFIQQELLYPVSDLKAFDFNESKWWKPGMEFAKVGSKQYALCASGGEFTVLLYNKDLFKQKNQPDLFSLQQDGSLTWNKIFEISRNLTSGDIYGIAGGQFPASMLQLLMHAYGGGVADRDQNSLNYTCTINSQNTIDAFNDVQKLLNVDKCFYPTNGDYTLYPNKFKEGKIGMLIEDAGVGKNTKFDCGFVILPKGRDATSFEPFIDQSSGELSAIPSTVKNPEEVAVIWNVLSEKTGTLDWVERFQDFVDEDGMKCLEQYMGYVAEGKYFIDHGQSLVNFWESNDALYNKLNSIALGQKTSAAGVQELESLYNAKIKDINMGNN